MHARLHAPPANEPASNHAPRRSRLCSKPQSRRTGERGCCPALSASASAPHQAVRVRAGQLCAACPCPLPGHSFIALRCVVRCCVFVTVCCALANRKVWTRDGLAGTLRLKGTAYLHLASNALSLLPAVDPVGDLARVAHEASDSTGAGACLVVLDVEGMPARRCGGYFSQEWPHLLGSRGSLIAPPCFRARPGASRHQHPCPNKPWPSRDGGDGRALLWRRVGVCRPPVPSALP